MLSKIKSFFTLKKRIIFIFLSILFLVTANFMLVVKGYVTSLVENHLRTTYEKTLIECCNEIENTLWNLTLVSQQLMDSDIFIPELLNKLALTDLVQQNTAYNTSRENFYQLTLSNTNVGLVYLYDISRDEILFENYPVNEKDVKTAPTNYLYASDNFSFIGPCTSQVNFFSNPVLILNRKITLDNGDAAILSIETGLYTLENAFSLLNEKNSILAFIDTNGDILYSTKELPASISWTDLVNEYQNQYHFYSTQANQGWSVYALIPNSEYSVNYSFLTRDFVIDFIFIAIILFLLGYFLWRSIWHPLTLFEYHLECLLSDQILEKTTYSTIPEFNHLFQKVFTMRGRINQMIQNLIQQEKMQSEMRLEKLRTQINPHFLLNTLNTIHWMALLHDVPDIDQLTQSLSRLLAYNLDKQSVYGSLSNELKAVSDYAELQKVRYQFNFKACIHPEDDSLNYLCPKFILQPIIENSLIHGYRENMSITVDVMISEKIYITVIDTGTGISSDLLSDLNNRLVLQIAKSENNTAPSSLGIGMQYVIQSLRDFTNEQYYFQLNHNPAGGTIVTIIFPKLRKDDCNAKSIDY